MSIVHVYVLDMCVHVWSLRRHVYSGHEAWVLCDVITSFPRGVLYSPYTVYVLLQDGVCTYMYMLYVCVCSYENWLLQLRVVDRSITLLTCTCTCNKEALFRVVCLLAVQHVTCASKLLSVWHTCSVVVCMAANIWPLHATRSSVSHESLLAPGP